MTIRFVLALLIVKSILTATTISVALADYKINAVTNYTWLISFTDLSSRTYMTFTFPTAVSPSPNSLAHIATTQITPSNIGTNSLTISTTGLTITSTMSIILTNIVNPSSALTSVRTFYFTSNFQTNIVLDLIASINYLPGSLSVCTWSFSKCTQQTNSLLTINITIVNKIPTGNHMISAGFPAIWANHYNKSPVSGVSSTGLSCSLSFNGAPIVSSGITCAFTSNTITVSYSNSAPIAGGSLIAVYIQGVNSPPTANTALSTQYTTKTSDSSGNTIDGIATGSACTIAPVCVTNYSVATFTPSSFSVNSQITTLTTLFSFYPTITFINSDAVEISYTDQSSLVGCSVFRVLRNINVYDLLSNSTGSLMSYYFASATTLPNTDYAFSISTYFQCTSITLPKSSDPTTFVYKFKRNGDQYLELTATLTASPVAFNASNATLSLTTNQMGVAATTYTFSFSNGQPLSASPSIALDFPSDISLGGVSCMMGVNGAVSPAPCSSISTRLTVNYTSGSSIAAGSSITIKVVGITNPLSPAVRTFGITTYYNSSLNTSTVQYNTAAFNTSYTAVTLLPVTLTPTAFTVYTLTSTNISFTTPIAIPASSTFSLVFPSDVSQISSTSQALLANSSFALLSATPTASGSTMTFYNLQQIQLGTNLVICLSLRSPAFVQIFPYVQLVISQGGLVYIQSLTSMLIDVTSTGVLPVTIDPVNSITGAGSDYLITLTLTIPHPSNFTVVVDVGSDTKFVSVGSSCASTCSLTVIGNSSFSLSVSNPFPNSTSPSNLIFTISSFVNSRNVGTGASWNITTKTSASDPISFQSASPIILVPNLLQGALEAGDYYRNNTDIVKMKINFTNLLISTDYLLFSMAKTTYDVLSNFTCSALYGSCSVHNATTTNVLVIQVIPNSNNLHANPLELWFQGLISGSSTPYLQIDQITVGSYSANGIMIDQGKIGYSIGCSDALSLPNNCRTCLSSGACLSCYVSQGYYLNGSTCVTSCGGATSYLYYGNSTSGTCQSCTTATNGCLTCTSQTACLQCLNASYYLYTNTLNCSLFCSNTSGYIATVLSGFNVCVPCADPNCLVCTSTSFGNCTQCSTTSILVSGICSNNCPSSSYYVLNAICVACDAACFTCTGGSSRNCIACSTGYYNFSGDCITDCPAGTAKIILTGICGCDPSCLTCDSLNYANCTACLNSSLLLYNGQCIASCPTSTYLSGSSCIACSSGCLNCTSSVCFSCSAGLYMFNSRCYGDCNSISYQYDLYNSTCILCPTGCDTCSNGACSSCLSDYTLSSSACIKTCILTNTCQIDPSNIVPLPGSISVIIWCIIVLIIRHFSHQNYIPYSIILLSSLVQFCLVLAIISQTSSTSVISRLLTMDLMSKNAVLILLGFSLALNYIANLIYLYIFIKYLKPLIINPKQIDVITNTVTLIIAVLTNYRFAIVAFSKMFPKPRIHIEMAKHLTPVHYICFASFILSIFPIVGCAMLIGKQQKLTTLYMLALDLLIIIVFNAVITVWFISSKKEDAYFGDELKKQYATDDINVTKENINEKQKDDSNVNMIASIHNSQKNSNQSDQYDFGESLKKMKAKKTQVKASHNNNNINNNSNDAILIDDLPEQSTIQREGVKKSGRNVFAIQNQYEDSPHSPQKADINFEEVIMSRREKMKQSPNKDKSGSDIMNEIMKSKNKLSRATTINRNYGSRQQKLNKSRQMDLDSQKFDKEFNHFNKDIKEVNDNEDGSYINMEDSYRKSDDHPQEITFQPKEKLARPKRISNQTSIGSKKTVKDQLQKNKTVMRKMPNKRYYEGQVTFDQKDVGEDLSSIIKMKVQESSIRKSQNISVLTHQENDLEQISPSYYNFQNQRFHLGDMDSSSNHS